MVSFFKVANIWTVVSKFNYFFQPHKYDSKITSKKPLAGNESPYNPGASPIDFESPVPSPSSAAVDDSMEIVAYKDVMAFSDIMKSKVKHEAKKHKRKKLEEMKTELEGRGGTKKEVGIRSIVIFIQPTLKFVVMKGIVRILHWLLQLISQYLFSFIFANARKDWWIIYYDKLKSKKWWKIHWNSTSNRKKSRKMNISTSWRKPYPRYSIKLNSYPVLTNWPHLFWTFLQ